MEKDENQTGYTLENGNMGQVQIADEVVAIIAGLAATEVEGVAHHLMYSATATMQQQDLVLPMQVTSMDV